MQLDGWLWGALAIVLVAWYVATWLVPRALTRFVSIPWVFYPRHNVGDASLETQGGIYTALHQGRLARWSHHGLYVDQALWMAAAAAIAGPSGVVIVVCTLVAQALTYGDRRFALVLSITWVAYGAAGLALAAALGSDTLLVSATGVVASAAIRSLGHAVEPVPPLISSPPAPRFLPYRRSGIRPLHLVPLFVVGTVAELASGLPWRLLPPMLWLTINADGRARSQAAARTLLEGGWDAWERTRPFFTWVGREERRVPA
jgi:hypothetical protein